MAEPFTRPVQVKFFAVLREQAGIGALDVQTVAPTPAELYRELQASHGLTLPASLLRVAINERYATMDAPLHAGDRVVFIPPVAGG
jgi:molybdopterin converting factor subunit 1